MSRHRATAALADRIAKDIGKNQPDIGDVRDICDVHTSGDFPPRALDRLADMVRRRLKKHG